MSNLGGKPLLPAEPSCQPYLFILFGWTRKLDAPRTSFSPTELLVSVSFPETREEKRLPPLTCLREYPAPCPSHLDTWSSGTLREEEDPASQGPLLGRAGWSTRGQGRRARGQSREPRSTWRSRGTAIEAGAGSAGGRVDAAGCGEWARAPQVPESGRWAGCVPPALP